MQAKPNIKLFENKRVVNAIFVGAERPHYKKEVATLHRWASLRSAPNYKDIKNGEPLPLSRVQSDLNFAQSQNSNLIELCLAFWSLSWCIFVIIIDILIP